MRFDQGTALQMKGQVLSVSKSMLWNLLPSFFCKQGRFRTCEGGTGWDAV